MLLAKSGALYTCESGDDGYGGRLKTAPPLGSFGQLGRDYETPSSSPLTPMRVAASSLGVAPPMLIAAGRCASFVADARGELYAWGCAQGSGHPPPDRRSPALLEALRGRKVHALAAGEYHAIAAVAAAQPAGAAGKGAASSTVVAWGAAAATSGSSRPVVEVTGLPGGTVLALAAGYQHSLAVFSECAI